MQPWNQDLEHNNHNLVRFSLLCTMNNGNETKLTVKVINMQTVFINICSIIVEHMNGRFKYDLYQLQSNHSNLRIVISDATMGMLHLLFPS
jgi:hypothetical protein